MNDQVVRSEGIEAENTSQYAEGVFELIQKIFNVEVEIRNCGTPVTRSRTRSEVQKCSKNRWSNCGDRSLQAKNTNVAQRDVVKYGSINVRSLVMKDDKYKRELCGTTAAATEWVLEFQARQLDVVGLQECRVSGNKVGSEGPYRTFYTGEEEKKVHGVGIFILEKIMTGEFEVQHTYQCPVYVDCRRVVRS
jgi:hypothetical protein